MNIHNKIEKKLKKGEEVYSLALGRVGQVMGVEHRKNGRGLDGVTICPQSYSNRDGRHRHTHGFTTFLRGDGVRMRKDKVRNRWLIVNKYWGRRWYERAWDSFREWASLEINRLKVKG